MIYSKWRSKCLRTVTTDQRDSFNGICLWENERAPPEMLEVHICEVKTYLTVQPRRGPAESTSQTCRPQLSRLGFGLALLGQFSILLPVQLLTLTQPLSHILWYYDNPQFWLCQELFNYVPINHFLSMEVKFLMITQSVFMCIHWCHSNKNDLLSPMTPKVALNIRSIINAIQSSSHNAYSYPNSCTNKKKH